MTSINNEEVNTKLKNTVKPEQSMELNAIKNKSREIDALVGKKIKLFRQLRGLSQSDIAEQLGITFQQFQKYESGKNRIPISRLMKLAETFRINIGVFFEKSVNVMFDDANQGKSNRLNEEVVPIEFSTNSNSSENIEKDEELINLIKNFKTIKDTGVKKHISMLVKTLSEEKSN